jgi:hypothetical protein
MMPRDVFMKTSGFNYLVDGLVVRD